MPVPSTPPVLARTPTPITSFRAEEGYISFYRESDFVAAPIIPGDPPVPAIVRGDLAPVGGYYFCLGMTFTQSTTEHPPYQAYGSPARGIRAAESTGSLLSMTGLLTQESNSVWLNAGHVPYRAYIDFVDTTLVVGRVGDTINTNNDHVQTIVVRDLVCIAKHLVATENQAAAYNLEFAAGESFMLVNTEMDWVV